MTEEIATTARILGALFMQDPKQDEGWALITQMQNMPLAQEWLYGSRQELLAIANNIQERYSRDRTALIREYQRLFIGPHHFEAPAWGSVYLDFERVQFGCSTLELRQWMRAKGITIAENTHEPEDHIGKMLLLLAWLAEEKPQLINEFLAEHLMPWAPRYLELLEADARNPFYVGLAQLTSITLEGICAELNVEPAKKKLYF